MTGSSVLEAPVVSVRDLRVELSANGVDIIDRVDLDLQRGEILGLVGESGCGKTTLALALLGYRRSGLRISQGRILVDGRDLLSLSEVELEHVRGSLVAYVPQDPATALNPAMRIETQLLEAVARIGGRGRRRTRMLEVLADVGLPSTHAFLRSYPHQLSGGQQQRVTIAMAFANRPHLIVMDEPTTGLDVTTQAHVLDTVRRLCREQGVATVYVSHDLAVVASLAQRVAVMYAGRMVEVGPVGDVLSSPHHPYVRGLIRAVPDVDGRRDLLGIRGQAPEPGKRGEGCFFAPRCPDVLPVCREAFPSPVDVAADHRAWCIRAAEQPVVPETDSRRSTSRWSSPPPSPVMLEVQGVSAWYGPSQVLREVSLAVAAGESAAIVGESGSGKTTLARCIAGLHGDLEGKLLLAGAPLAAGARARSPELRRTIQYVFQNPYASLNPRRTIGESVVQPLRHFERMSRSEADDRVRTALEEVALRPSLIDRYPHQLSGGERQRVAIARALALSPQLLICDEVTSSLDVSVQAVIIQLLAQLQRERGLTMLFVTHNLALVRTIARRVAVMSEGRVVESGLVDDVLARPQAPETQRLVRDIPRFDPARFRLPA